MSVFSFIACKTENWRTASRESAGIAPLAENTQEDIFQIYVARTFGWRGTLAVHPWVAWKRSSDKSYTTVNVLGWRAYRGGNSVVVKEDLPDRYWFGKPPELIFQLNGEKAREVIKQVEELIINYPYSHTYRLWPGPNSNSFVAYIIRNVDGIDVELPPHAIGKDWLGKTSLFAKSPSGTGYQLSLWGALGFTVGLYEGLEFNILGLNWGIDFYRPAIKLPFVGRLGFADRSIPEIERN